jgi:hypothetical protein
MPQAPPQDPDSGRDEGFKGISPFLGYGPERECAAQRRTFRYLRDLQYHHRHRTHRGLDEDCPEPRLVEPPEQGKIIVLPLVGGLQHRYTRQAA